MNFRNSRKMPLILVREFWNLVREKSGNFTFYDLWEPCNHDDDHHHLYHHHQLPQDRM